MAFSFISEKVDEGSRSEKTIIKKKQLTNEPHTHFFVVFNSPENSNREAH